MLSGFTTLRKQAEEVTPNGQEKEKEKIND